MRSPLVVAVVAFLGVVGTPSLTQGHHFFGAIYLEDATATIEGVVMQVMFRNPHSLIQLSVPGPDGDVRYKIEWRGAAQLMQQGVTGMSLHVGDRLVITGNPARNAQDRWLRVATLLRPQDGFAWRRSRDEEAR